MRNTAYKTVAAFCGLAALLIAVRAEEQKDARAQTVKTSAIGDGTLLVDLPKSFEIEEEGEDTILARNPSNDAANLRFTVLTIKPKSGRRGEEIVRGHAVDKKKGVEKIDDKVVLSYEENSEQEGEKIVMKFWEVGYGDSVIVVSSCILNRKKDDPFVAEVLACVPKAINSMRRKPTEPK